MFLFISCKCAGRLWLAANGPAIRGVCVGRRRIRAESSYPATAGPESCHGARRPWRDFWHPGTNFCKDYACRGKSLIEARKLSPVTKLVGSTGAVSRYKLSRSQESVVMQDFKCGQMRVSGW